MVNSLELSLGTKLCDIRTKIIKLGVDIPFESLYTEMVDFLPSSNVGVERFISTLVEYCFKYLNKHNHYCKKYT